MSDEPMLIDPNGHVLAAFATSSQAAAVETQLVEAGWSYDDIRVLVGEAGVESIDVTGEEHGFLGRAIRVLQQMGDEQMFLARYAEDLEAGAVVLMVRADDAEAKDRIHAIVAEHDGRDIVYFGDLMIEELPPRPDGQ